MSRLNEILRRVSNGGDTTTHPRSQFKNRTNGSAPRTESPIISEKKYETPLRRKRIGAESQLVYSTLAGGDDFAKMNDFQNIKKGLNAKDRKKASFQVKLQVLELFAEETQDEEVFHGELDCGFSVLDEQGRVSYSYKPNRATQKASIQQELEGEN